jgi:molybdate transport system substrate-binding protein
VRRFASAFLLLVLGCGGGKKPAPIKVAAASDLTFAFAELGKAFRAKTGSPVVFSFGSSGQLAKQIEQGAPFDLFAAANVTFVDETIQAGACDPATKASYAQGRIVLWGPKLSPATTPRDLTQARFVKIAIANPEHAPYGQAAKQALQAAGVWDAVAPKLVYGENIKQTMQFAQSGNAEAAIVALSLAIVDHQGSFAPIDPSLYQPLDQALVVCKHGRNPAGARDLAAFVASPEGRAIMSRYGFTL